jgi:hypothetical protein
VRLEVLRQLKNSVTSLVIETATFRLVHYCLNQLRYRVPLNYYNKYILNMYYWEPGGGGQALVPRFFWKIKIEKKFIQHMVIQKMKKYFEHHFCFWMETKKIQERPVKIF